MNKCALAALLCLIPLSSTAIAAEPASAQPKGYLIAEIAVHDAVAYERYKSAVAPLIAQFGGRYLTRGGASEAIEGDPVRGRVIVLEFPNVAAARSFLQSDAYQPVADIRYKSATSRVIMVEGIAP